MSESEDQIAVIEWCDLNRVPAFHVPNGGYRNKREAMSLKRQGVRAGVPDIFVPIACGGYHGLFIELKVGSNKATDKQIDWIRLLRRNGYAAYICYGYESAIECIRRYLNG